MLTHMIIIGSIKLLRLISRGVVIVWMIRPTTTVHHRYIEDVSQQTLRIIHLGGIITSLLTKLKEHTS